MVGNGLGGEVNRAPTFDKGEKHDGLSGSKTSVALSGAPVQPHVRHRTGDALPVPTALIEMERAKVLTILDPPVDVAEQTVTSVDVLHPEVAEAT